MEAPVDPAASVAPVDASPDAAEAADLERIFGQLSLAASPAVHLVHEGRMQAHAPGVRAGFLELPERLVAIECMLRGHGPLAAPPPAALVPAEAASHRYAWGDSSPVRAPLNPRTVAAQARRTAQSEPLARLMELVGPAVLDEQWKPADIPPATPDSLWSKCQVSLAPVAPLDWLQLVHAEPHLRRLARKALIAHTGGVSFQDVEDQDLYFNQATVLAARLAAGGAVEAVRLLFQDNHVPSEHAPSSFAIIRPPGHHCSAETPSGFCFFSNAAIAVQYARKVLGLERVAIVDTDYHPGDGSQSIFYEDTVLTISTHVAARVRDYDDIDDLTMPIKPRVAWPFRADKGVLYGGNERGRGLNINIPFPNEYVDDCEFEEALTTIIKPALQRFRPQLIVWSCGFDAVQGDSLAGTKLTPRGYFRIAAHLKSLNVPLAVMLEGGYSPELIAESARHVVEALLRDPKEPLEPLKVQLPRPNISFSDEHSPTRQTPLNLPWRPYYPGLCRTEAVLEKCRRFLNHVWGEKVLLETQFETSDAEPCTVEDEFALFHQQLEDCPFNRESDAMMMMTDAKPAVSTAGRVRRPRNLD